MVANYIMYKFIVKKFFLNYGFNNTREIFFTTRNVNKN